MRLKAATPRRKEPHLDAPVRLILSRRHVVNDASAAKLERFFKWGLHA
jgi:hypothetical protein